MEVYIKESLYVLDYKDNIVEPIFISDDHDMPGYAYDITITESNMGYSDLVFTMPTKIMPIPSPFDKKTEEGKIIANPKLKLLPPLTKIRYHREIFFTGPEEVHVYEPEGYGDEINYIEKIYKPGYPDNIIEDYVMDYIVQPVESSRSNLQTSMTFTAMDYPRYNLSKKKFGTLIDEKTVTRSDWSIWSVKPMDIPGEVKYLPWSTEYLADTSLTWDPTCGAYPLTYSQVQELMKKTDIWSYGLTATIFYWPITKTGRFEGILYVEGDYLTLTVYPKNLVETMDVDTVTLNVGKYACDIMTCFLNEDNSKSWKPSGAATSAQIDIIEDYQEDVHDQYKGYVYDVQDLPDPNNYNQGDWIAVVTDISQSLEFYGYDWLGYDKGQPYLTPNGAANYLNWILENTNWTIKHSYDKYLGTVTEIEDLSSLNPQDGDYALVKTFNKDDPRCHQPGVGTELPNDNCHYGEWFVLQETNTESLKTDYHLYRYDGEEWNIDYTDLVTLVTTVYQFNDGNWDNITDKALALSIDKTTGALYDVDTPSTEVFAPLVDNEGIEDSRLTTSINVSESNCYNVITEICKAFQLYPIFDCIERTISLKMFAGKNYGLTYNLGLSIQNDNRTDDGEQVITKLRCYGGQDHNGEEAINLGDANRQAAVDREIIYTVIEPSTPTITDDLYHIYIIDPQLNEDAPWEMGPNRILKVYTQNGEISGVNNYDGTWTFGDLVLDAQTGLNAPWSPNDPSYIFARSPYGTEYIYNFQYLYNKGWMSKEDILGLYKKSLEIQELNHFVVDYAKAYTDIVDAYTAAVVDYETYQDEYMAVIDNMRNKYWYDQTQAHYGTFMAFPTDDYPSDITIEDGKHILKLYWCSNPDCLYLSTTPANTCPNCGSLSPLEEHSILLPDWHEIDIGAGSPGTGDERRDLKVTGNYSQIRQKFKDTIPQSAIKMTKGWDMYTTSSNITQHEFDINGTLIEDQSDLLYEWNGRVEKWSKYYRLMLLAQKRIEKYQTLVEKITKAYDIYSAKLGELEDYIQDHWGDYIVEGKFKDDTICYTSILMTKSLEASEQYCIPKTTYSLNVVDSSGLIEYRSFQPAVYNDLVHSLHSVGQIVPKAGDYVSVYDEEMNFNGVPAVITQITRNIDNPMNNSIQVDTSYTDNDELVGNIITATNTVLSNADIYARTAVLNGDGTLSMESLNKTLQNGANTNVSMVGSKGSYVLDSTGMITIDPGDENHKMKYGGAGVFSSSDGGATWQKLVDGDGINANYISAGLIDTRKIQISSGAADAKVILNTNGLVVKTDPTKGYSIPTLDPGQTIHNWTNANNVSAFIGVDNDNQAAVHIEGDITATSGKIAGWNIESSCLQKYTSEYSFEIRTDRASNEPALLVNKYQGDNLGYTFYVRPDGYLYAKSAEITGNITAETGKIGGWEILPDKLRKTSRDNIYSVGMASNDWPSDPAFWAGYSINGSHTDPWGDPDWQNHTACYITNEGYLKANNADISGNITANSLSLASSITLPAGQVSGTLTAATISGSRIDAGIISTSHIHLKNDTVKMCPSGRVEFSNNSTEYNGFFSMGPTSSDSGAAATNHPYVSGLNLAYGTYYGLSFRDSDSITSVGSQIGQIYTTVGVNALTGTMTKNLYLTSAGSGIVRIDAKTSDGNKGYIQLDASNTYVQMNQVYSKYGTDSTIGGNSAWLYFITNSGDSAPRIKGSTYNGNNRLVLLASTGIYAGGSNSNDKVATYGGFPSSRNIKTNLHKLDNEYDDIFNDMKTIGAYTYDYKFKNAEENYSTGYGFIIDEIEETATLSKYFRNYTTRYKVLDNTLYHISGDETEEELAHTVTVKTWDFHSYIKGLFVMIKTLQHKIIELEDKIKEKE